MRRKVAMKLRISLGYVGLVLAAAPTTALAQQDASRAVSEEAVKRFDSFPVVVLAFAFMLLVGLLLHGIEWLWDKWLKRDKKLS
jgi:hypothetical protein